MEDAGTLEEDDIGSQDYTVSIDHSHLAWNYLTKINSNQTQLFHHVTLKVVV